MILIFPNLLKVLSSLKPVNVIKVKFWDIAFLAALIIFSDSPELLIKIIKSPSREYISINLEREFL